MTHAACKSEFSQRMLWAVANGNARSSPPAKQRSEQAAPGFMLMGEIRNRRDEKWPCT